MIEEKKALTLENMPDLCLKKEVAEFFRVRPETVAVWLKEKKFPQAFKLGGQWRFPKEDIMALAHSMYGKVDEDSED